MDKTIQEVESLMDDDVMEQFENLYMIIVAKLSGKDAAEDLWPRYQELYDATVQPETAVVGMVGRENGFPDLWGLLGGMIAYMHDNRAEGAPDAATDNANIKKS